MWMRWSSSKRTTSISNALEQRLQYRFTDRGLLVCALTHKSFGRPHNERLEYLGDAVLGYLIACELFDSDTPYTEAELTLARASLVRGRTLAAVAREIGLGAHLRLGAGELRSGGHTRESLLANALEALIGAVHQDGGIDAARAVVRRIFAERLAGIDVESIKDAKTRLQEYLQARGQPLPTYEVTSTEGRDHERSFTVECRTDDSGRRFTGTGRSRRAAEKQAAQSAIDALTAADAQ